MRARVAPLALALAALLPTCSDAPEPDARATLDSDTMERLAALGYTDWSEAAPGEAARASGVTRYDRAAAYDGWNLYTSLPHHEAQLIDMTGRLVHSWHAPPGDAKPWHHVEVNDAGELFGVNKKPLQKLSFRSELLWELPLSVHHDLAFDAQGRIYALNQELRRVRGVPIIDNEIVVLDPDGAILRRHSFAELFPDTLGDEKLQAIARYLDEKQGRGSERLFRSSSPPDVFHANSIELLHRDVPGMGSAGDALVAIRSLDMIAVIDLRASRVVWRWGPGVIDHPHHATLQGDGSVSLFDNGWNRSWSRVLRVDAGGRILWQYPEQPHEGFYSKRRGSAQHLPNGNVLITESEQGHVFEIDPQGRVVWEFFNPRANAKTGARAKIYRMERIGAERRVALQALRDGSDARRSAELDTAGP